tara:strand:+ start:219956 stop:222157 length:2202 start_codon:yes stop_codon:yes gene_type:complete
MKIKSSLLAILLSTSSFNSAWAAEEVGDAAIVTYDKNYFEKFAPVTLLDMLQRIPGVPEILAMNREQNQQRNRQGAQSQGERGFGSGGDQILINGKRLAGKTNNIDDTLSRVSASQVLKVDLIRGATEGLDVQSQGLVINVTMNEGASTSTTFWKVTGRYYNGHNDVPPELLVSHSGSAGNLQYMLSGELKSTRGFMDRDELHYDAADVNTGEKAIENKIKDKATSLNANLSYGFEGGSELRLNGLFEPSTRTRNEIQIETGSEPLHTVWDTLQEYDKWEVGGDYGTSLGALGQFKALFVINRNKEVKTVDRQRDLDTDNEFQYASEITDLNKSEKILRASTTKSIFRNQSLEVGAEVAINTFDKIFSDNRRSVAADPLLLTTSDEVEITENRYEVFANHTYNIASNIVLQSSLITEFSKIVADNISSGVPQPQRNTSFTYLKPRLNLRYDASATDQVRMTAEKKVSQLDFNNFVTSFDQRTDQFVFGNTNIRPEQVWEFSAAYEHRFANDGGSVEAEIFYRRYKDHITKVDFTEYQDAFGNPIGVEEFFALDPDMALRDMINFTSKSGNIDKATAKGVKLKSNLRLGFLGLSEAVIGLSYVYEKRRAIDQFTFERANFNRVSDHTFNFNFRHDVTDYEFSYGLEGRVKNSFDNRDKNYTWPWNQGMYLKVFAEKFIFNGIKLRLEAQQYEMGTGDSTLTFYYDQRRFNEVRERSEKHHTRAQEIMISLQGTF